MAIEIYLDTNAINYCFSPRPGWSKARLTRIRKAIRRHSRSDRIRLVGSPSLFEELAGIHRGNPSLYHAASVVMTHRIRRRIFCSLVELTAREMANGKPLAGPERFIERNLVKTAAQALRDSSAVTLISDQTYADGQSFKKTFEDNRKALLTSLGLSRAGSKETQAVLKQWWAQGPALVDGWVLQILNDERQGSRLKSGIPPAATATAQSLRRFCAYHMARLVLTIGLGRAIKPSDANDARHYAYAGYADLLISDDGPFRDTCELVRWEKTAIKSFEEFTHLIES